MKGFIQSDLLGISSFHLCEDEDINLSTKLYFFIQCFFIFLILLCTYILLVILCLRNKLELVIY